LDKYLHKIIICHKTQKIISKVLNSHTSKFINVLYLAKTIIKIASMILASKKHTFSFFISNLNHNERTVTAKQHPPNNKNQIKTIPTIWPDRNNFFSLDKKTRTNIYKV